MHAVQGGYFYKSFGKHGPLHNLYAYHYFPELERDQVPGGPPTGGTIYLGDSFPRQFRGSFIAGNFLGHSVSWWNVAAAGNTVQPRMAACSLIPTTPGSGRPMCALGPTARCTSATFTINAPPIPTRTPTGIVPTAGSTRLLPRMQNRRRTSI